MTKEHKKFLKIQVLLSLVINFLGNGAIAYFTNTKKAYELISKQQNFIDIFFDIAITAIILAWLIAWSVNAGVKDKKLYASLERNTKFKEKVGDFFRWPATYGWILCIGIVPIFYGISLLIFTLTGFEHFTLWTYTIYKASYAGLMGALFSFLFILTAFHGNPKNIDIKKKKKSKAIKE